MSDFGDDIDDEILALATEDSDKKRKRKASGSGASGNVNGAGKRRKADLSKDSYDTPESEVDEDMDPYQLEGKYKNEEDRQWLLQLAEIERERILADRADQKQQLADKRILSQMVREQRGVTSSGNGEDDRVSPVAKRQHTARGVTKEKTKKLDELKAKRKAKDEKKKSRQLSPKRERSSSPNDMEISDDESEDGQITKFDEEEEKERRLLDRLNSGSKKAEEDDEPATLADLEKCRLTRDTLAKYCMAPWFEEFVQGAWVRFLIGNSGGEGGGPVYRICEILNLAADLVKPYKLNERTVNQAFELKHGKSIKVFTMDKVSNGAFAEREYHRWTSACTHDEEKLPTKKHLERKVEQMKKLSSQPITESDINAMLARKLQMSRNKPAAFLTMERSRLNQARTLAQRRQDYVEVAEIDKQLSALNANIGISEKEAPAAEAEDKLAKVNERNRKANLEAVRRAEMAEAERKKKERMLAVQGRDGRSTTPHDPSARLKTVPRVFAATPVGSRPGTPSLGPSQPSNGTNTPRQVSPLPPSVLSGKGTGVGGAGQKTTFETSIINSVEVDLGDF